MLYILPGNNGRITPQILTSVDNIKAARAVDREFVYIELGDLSPLQATTTAKTTTSTTGTAKTTTTKLLWVAPAKGHR